jgi:uncharacterized protein YegP (UPF0339 family)
LLERYLSRQSELRSERHSEMYFDIYKSTKNGQYWWVAKGENNKTLCSSELMTTKQACKNGIRVLKDGAAGAFVYDETGEVAGDTSARRVTV